MSPDLNQILVDKLDELDAKIAEYEPLRLLPPQARSHAQNVRFRELSNEINPLRRDIGQLEITLGIRTGALVEVSED